MSPSGRQKISPRTIHLGMNDTDLEKGDEKDQSDGMDGVLDFHGGGVKWVQLS